MGNWAETQLSMANFLQLLDKPHTKAKAIVLVRLFTPAHSSQDSSSVNASRTSLKKMNVQEPGHFSGRRFFFTHARVDNEGNQKTKDVKATCPSEKEYIYIYEGKKRTLKGPQ